MKAVKELIQWQCISLYRPYEYLAPKIPEFEEFSQLFKKRKSQEKGVPNISFLTREGAKRQKEAITVSKDEEKLIKILLAKMGQKFFIDYYAAYANEEDLMNIIPADKYTYSSAQTRISTMRRIFREDLNLKALKYILSKENSKLGKASITLAQDLMELG